MLVDHDTFLQRLTSLFEESSKTSGRRSIWLTHKRLTMADGDTAMDSVGEDTTYPCLIRATDGGKVKFSTHVNSNDLPKFHSHYSTLLKAQMTLHLRKRDKKREKQKSEEITKKRKIRETPLQLDPKPDAVDLQGKPIGKVSKRAAGRRKRQRMEKMLRTREEKQQAAKAIKKSSAAIVQS
ncbi:signal recognition particle 14kD protein-domain-containing protein [Flagelloscypha sp. PMI_526]|nr:signal recognition particle 14kD protein-domain-containing protein [Flagelloscypha sp. PMI_526]